MIIDIDKLSNRVPKPASEYLGDDGLLHCSVCHKAVQTIVYPFGKERVVRCICDCRKKELEESKNRERQREIERRRNVCFAETNMKNWTFENDNRKNAKLSDAMIRYTEKFPEFLKDGKGLLLYGPVGTGKTFAAACIANRLLDKGYKVLMTDFTRLVNEIQSMYEGKQQYIDSLNRYSLIILDDLGVERKTDFMQEQVFNVINSRYKSGLPFIVTTNLTAQEIKNPQEVSYSRIYDRILERCHPIEVTGQSQRRAELKRSFADVQEALEL